MWNHTFNFTFIRSNFVVALQAAISEINVSFCGNTSSFVGIQYISDGEPLKIWSGKYIEPKIISSQNAVLDSFVSSMNSIFGHVPSINSTASAIEKMNVETVLKCKTNKEHNKHTHIVSTRNMIYVFVKYMDNTISSTTEYSDYLELTWNLYGFTHFYNDTYPTCPNITHNPKLFSWKQALRFCKECLNGTLPQFVSRDDQEEFFSIIRDEKDLFFLESIFIGLQKVSGKTVS